MKSSGAPSSNELGRLHLNKGHPNCNHTNSSHPWWYDLLTNNTPYVSFKWSADLCWYHCIHVNIHMWLIKQIVATSFYLLPSSVTIRLTLIITVEITKPRSCDTYLHQADLCEHIWQAVSYMSPWAVIIENDICMMCQKSCCAENMHDYHTVNGKMVTTAQTIFWNAFSC